MAYSRTSFTLGEGMVVTKVGVGTSTTTWANCLEKSEAQLKALIEADLGVCNDLFVHLDRDHVPVLSTGADPGYMPEDARDYTWRYLKVQDEEMQNQATLEAAIQKAITQGFNGIIIVVGSGSVAYRSTLLPTYYVTDDFDPLGYACTRCKALGLAIYPWWVVGAAPMYSAEFRAWYPDFNAAGKYGIPVGANWLDMSLPEARQLVADVAEEMVTNYDFTGLNVDYIRWPYEDDYGFDFMTVFNAAQVTETVRGAYRAAKLVKPRCLFNAHVIPNYATDALPNVGQDWYAWLDDEMIDVVFPMMYYSIADTRFHTRLDEYILEAWFPQRIYPTVGCMVVWPLPGEVYGTLKPPADLINVQVDPCVVHGFNGVVMFDNNYFSDAQAAAWKAYWGI